MREYLRRSALWSLELNTGKWPFFDAASYVAPDVKVDLSAISSITRDPDNDRLTKETCAWALHMAAVEESGTPLPDLPNMFEPLIIMYERGGEFSLSTTKTIDVDLVGVPLGNILLYAKSKARISMEKSLLDELDK
ncbi:hypothetical protein [Nocardiopsis sp. NPDC057823]|uniref:hypothetical protein n=1 Tax=Nocardiopsis sp. NPDC057823 TaxID=3346256 RepID=UPI00367235C1